MIVWALIIGVAAGLGIWYYLDVVTAGMPRVDPR